MACQWMPLASSSGGERVPGGVQQPVQGQVVLEGGPQHRPGAQVGVVQAAGGGVPAGELRRGGGLPGPGEGVQQHHLLGVERPVEGQQGLIPAEEPRIRRPRQPPGRARGRAVPVPGGGEVDQRRLGAAWAARRVRGAAS